MKRYGMMLLFLFVSSISVFAQEAIKIDSFETRFSDWKVKVFMGQADFWIRNTPKPMITLSTTGSNYMLIREFKDFDLRQFPILTFEWKVEKHPFFGDLRKKETDDQAAGLYLTLPFFPEMVNFTSIGYVWEDTAPVGVYPSLWSTNIKYVVLRSGAAGLGLWHTERRNIVEDFKTLWGITVTQKRKIVVCLAANSNNTKSASLASFGRMSFLKQ